MATAYPSTSTSIASRLAADLPQNDPLAETSDEALVEIHDVADFLDRLAEDQEIPTETLLPAYSWWLGALSAKETNTYQSLDPYVPWIWIFDALALTAPQTISDAVAESIDDFTAASGGPRFLLTPTGGVSKDSGFLATVLLGSESTVGDTFPGWTIRRIARWYCALVLAEGYSEVSDVAPEKADQLAKDIMTRAVRLDPMGTVKDDETKKSFLGFIEATAANAGDSTVEDIAADQHEAIDKGDPLSNTEVAKAVAKAPAKAAAMLARKAREATENFPDNAKKGGNMLLVAGGLAALGFGIYIASSISPRRR